MSIPLEGTGFTAPTDHALGEERGNVAVAALITTAALAISTIVAATVVTVGIARANAADSVIDNEGSFFVIALVLGLIFIGIGSFSILPPRHRPHRH